MAKQCKDCLGRKTNRNCKTHIARGGKVCDGRWPENPFAAANKRIDEHIAEIEAHERRSGNLSGMRIRYQDKRMWNGAPVDGSSSDNI